MDVKPAARRDEAFERLLPDPEEIEEALGYSADRDISAAIVTTPTDDLKAYCCLFVMGAAILIPFNSVINSIEYLRSRLIDSPYEASVGSFVSLSFTASNLVFLYEANRSQRHADLRLRTTRSISLMMAVLALFFGSTMFDHIKPVVFFCFLGFATVALGAATAYLHNAVVLVSSALGPIYLQAILSGQGGIGLVISLIQLVAAYAASPTPVIVELNASGRSPADDSAFFFFLVIMFITSLALVAQGILMILPSYGVVTSRHEDAKTAPISTSKSFKIVEKKVRTMGFAVMYIFTVTLSVFPAITGRILSVNEGPHSAKFFTPTVFISFAFVVFAVGDWIGRAAPAYQRLLISNQRILVIASLARTLLIPLFLMCNLQPNHGTPTINSDFGFFIIMGIFAISNGYFSTSCLVAGIALDSLEGEHEKVLAGTVLTFYLTVGLAVGSLLSFAIRGVVCSCNPFTG